MGTYVIDEQNMKTQTEPNQKDGHYHEEVEGRFEDVLEPRQGSGRLETPLTILLDHYLVHGVPGFLYLHEDEYTKVRYMLEKS